MGSNSLGLVVCCGGLIPPFDDPLVLDACDELLGHAALGGGEFPIKEGLGKEVDILF
jgi:hypothetical protein